MDPVATGVELADNVLAIHASAQSVQTTEGSAAHTESSTATERHDAGRAHQEQRSKTSPYQLLSNLRLCQLS